MRWCTIPRAQEIIIIITIIKAESLFAVGKSCNAILSGLLIQVWQCAYCVILNDAHRVSDVHPDVHRALKFNLQ